MAFEPSMGERKDFGQSTDEQKNKLMQAYEGDLDQLRTSAKEQGIELERFLPKPGQAFDYSILDAVGKFVIDHPGEEIVGLTTLVGVWLKARMDRKVRLKVGDMEGEAHTREEVIKLLKDAAQEIQSKNEPKKNP